MEHSSGHHRDIWLKTVCWSTALRKALGLDHADQHLLPIEQRPIIRLSSVEPVAKLSRSRRVGCHAADPGRVEPSIVELEVSLSWLAFPESMD
jgi:hypothetical protein